jgi:hypothetical protein
MRSRLRTATSVAVAALAATAIVAQPAAAKDIRHGIYDCEAYNYATGLLDYQGSVKIRSKHRYQHSYGRKGRKLTKPDHGHYRIKGKRIRFKGGGLAKTPGRIHRPTKSDKRLFWNVYVDGKPSGVSCYYVTHP